MEERKNEITMHGQPLTLLGKALKIGDPAPDFALLDNDLNPVSLKDFSGKICVISAVPSLDTPVCDMETRRFNEAAVQLGDDVTVITVSMDLPFAQKRWCGNAGVDKVVTLSDHREAFFGKNYGVLIKELRLLARVVFVIDKTGTIQYVQTVKELSEEPDYDAVMNAIAQLT